MRVTEQELREYANKRAESIVVRTYNEHGSRDDRRKTTKTEKRIISAVILGGLLAIRDGADRQSVQDACEYVGKLLIPAMNGYDTIYNPIREYREI
jgi:hypothetical protein